MLDVTANLIYNYINEINFVNNLIKGYGLWAKS